MKRVTFAQGCAGVFLLYCLLAAALYGIAGEQFFWRNGQTLSVPESTAGAEPLSGAHVLEQSFRLSGGRVDSLAFKPCTYGRENRGELLVELVNEDGAVLAGASFNMGQLPDNELVTIPLPEPVKITSGRQYTLRLSGRDAVPEQAASAVYDQGASLPDGVLRYDGQELPGALCIELQQSDALWLGPHY